MKRNYFAPMLLPTNNSKIACLPSFRSLHHSGDVCIIDLETQLKMCPTFCLHFDKCHRTSRARMAYGNVATMNPLEKPNKQTCKLKNMMILNFGNDGG